jgi:hypothetical protein
MLEIRSLIESSTQVGQWGFVQRHNRKKSEVALSSPILGFSNQPAMATQSKHNTILCLMQGGPGNMISDVFQLIQLSETSSIIAESNLLM